MQLTQQKTRVVRPQLNMAAMIDVVFLLLTFFMCTSSFSTPEDQLRTHLPKIGSVKGTAAEDFEPIRILLHSVDGGVLVQCDGQPCATFMVLAEKLRARREVADIPVIVQGQGTVPFGYMVAAVDACHSSGLRRVAFLADGI